MLQDLLGQPRTRLAWGVPEILRDEDLPDLSDAEEGGLGFSPVRAKKRKPKAAVGKGGGKRLFPPGDGAPSGPAPKKPKVQPEGEPTWTAVEKPVAEEGGADADSDTTAGSSAVEKPPAAAQVDAGVRDNSGPAPTKKPKQGSGRGNRGGGEGSKVGG
ncbi:hypothetical protein BDW59DRAFT_147774 [Aspergillus cavernicola]|uniref:Uncharacterized protein n=1 Tax=Aspergillus cavernicola TaxID=176166 RepID=A0ABR4I967_9EURO